ncbi:hypothetical protein BC830DRAFT_1162711 [Chytriomyces sp. MP71]|nr:hypothetical protein BC830DRAFT_1162711 [Chytriomyces sp. MP71]
MRDVTPAQAMAQSAATLVSATSAASGAHTANSKMSPALLAKLNAYEQKAIPPSSTMAIGTTHRRPSLPHGITRRVSQPSDPASHQRASVAARRESLTRAKLEDSLPSAAGSVESLAPKIATAIETLREQVVSKNPVSPVNLPPTTVVTITSAQNKCEKCNKTVYAMEELTYDDHGNFIANHILDNYSL